MPASVIAAVPPGWIRASLVWTCVCVPITAVTRPSSQRATATFSLVASAWKSTIDDLRLLPRLLDERVDDLERPARDVEEERAHQVDDRDRRPVGGRRDRERPARRAGRDVRRADHPLRLLEVGRRSRRAPRRGCRA